MIARALIGAVAAAVAMFIIGFIFFATPLKTLGIGSVDNAQAAAVQQAMAANLPSSGTYSVPIPNTAEQTVMYGRGPIATIHYNSKGFSHSDPAVMIGGFVHMLVVDPADGGRARRAFALRAGFGERVRLLVIGVVAAVAYMRLGGPIWFHHDWGNAIYVFVADSISLIVAGLIILKLLPKRPAPGGDDGGLGAHRSPPCQVRGSLSEQGRGSGRRLRSRGGGRRAAWRPARPRPIARPAKSRRAWRPPRRFPGRSRPRPAPARSPASRRSSPAATEPPARTACARRLRRRAARPSPAAGRGG